MIARVWRGWAAVDHAPEVAAHLRDVSLARYASAPGHVSGYVLQRPAGGGVELMTVSVWESSEAVPAGVEEEHRLLVARQTTASCWEIVGTPNAVAQAA
jgi:heme-degrading monooxygenase HmoA